MNMHLEAGGIRELHWHQTAEWAVMTRGKCRVTTLSRAGLPSVEDVEEGDLWFFPAGTPHSLQGLGPDGAEFVLAFDDGDQSESNTLLLTDWFAHTPARGAGEELRRRSGRVHATSRCTTSGSSPARSPAISRPIRTRRVSSWGASEPVIFRLSRSQPRHQNSGGSIQIADSTNFPLSNTVAAALVTVEPGSMRELHWHPNADEWQYYLRGSARMTVFNTGPHANTTDFRPGDVGVVKRNSATTSRTPATTSCSSSRCSAPRRTRRSLSRTGSRTCHRSSCQLT